MFITRDENEFHVPGGLLDDGERCWTAVRTPFLLPWFHAEVSTQAEPDVHPSETLFLESLRQLIALQERPDLDLKRVSLVSPPYLNGTDDWRMDPLAEIRVVTEVHETEGGASSSTIYVLRDGRQLKHDGADVDIQESATENVIIRFR